MFVRDFIHVDLPFEVVAPRFVSDTSWLAPIAEDAALVARDLARTLADRGEAAGGNGNGNGPTVHHDRTSGVVRCEVGPVRARAHSIVVPMWLTSVHRGGLLPDLTGDLEVAPVGAHRTLVALAATYRRTAQEREQVLQVERATEAGVRTFLNGIAAHLGRPVPAL